MTSVPAAVAAVDYDHFVTEPDGSKLPQSSAVASIERMLTDLDVAPGQRVLEIGTGSGYTTALLSRLVGAAGSVHSVEVFADLVPRAQERLARAGVTNATVTCGDGYAGHAPGAPYDRVIAWATPHLIPAPWTEQIADDAVIVAPVKIAPLATANAISTITVTGGTLAVTTIRPGSYIEMHPEPVTNFGLPIRYVDAFYIPDNAEPWWISSVDLHGSSGDAQKRIDQLRRSTTTEPTMLHADESLQDLSAWLYATLPANLATAGLSDRYRAIGASTPDSAAFLTPTELVTSTTEGDASGVLKAWVGEWRTAGRPGWNDVMGTIEASDDGWTVRIITD
ncbi:hypothetical protein GCM10028784_32330 [Myceligenerans cantabricum]